MGEMTEKALAKLAAEYDKGEYGRAARIMKRSVRDALETFIRQDAEFAQAVAQGGAFGKCGEGYVRMSYATSLEKIRKAVERIADMLRA